MFISLSLKISILQCTENNESIWEKMIHQSSWNKRFFFFLFFLFFPFCSLKRKNKWYISDIKNRKQLAASDMLLFFRFRTLILLLKGPVLLRQNTHRDQWQPFVLSQFIVSGTSLAGLMISRTHMGWTAQSKFRHFSLILCEFIQQQEEERSSFRREKIKGWILGQAEF